MPIRSLMLPALAALVLFSGLPARGQSPAVPLLANGKAELSMSLQMTRAVSEFNADRHAYSGMVGKIGFSLNPRSDLYAILGLGRYSIRYSRDERGDFQDRYHWIYGAGLTRTFPATQRLTIYLNAQFVLLNPSSRTRQSFDNQKTGLFRIQNQRYQRLQFHSGGYLGYRWKRVIWFAGLEWQYRSITETNSVFLDQEGQVQQVSRTVQLYARDRLLLPSLGLNFSLPHRQQLGVHIQGTDRKNLAVTVGLSQTGPIDD